jgi:hypothetical protein
MSASGTVTVWLGEVRVDREQQQLQLLCTATATLYSYSYEYSGTLTPAYHASRIFMGGRMRKC